MFDKGNHLEQIPSFIPFILVDERRTEASGLQNKMTLVNDFFFFLLNDCLTIKKRKKRKVEWETLTLTHCGVWSAPSPAGPAGLGVSGWLPEVPEGSLQVAASLVSLAYSGAFYTRVAWAQEWS